MTDSKVDVAEVFDRMVALAERQVFAAKTGSAVARAQELVRDCYAARAAFHELVKSATAVERADAYGDLTEEMMQRMEAALAACTPANGETE